MMRITDVALFEVRGDFPPDERHAEATVSHPVDVCSPRRGRDAGASPRTTDDPVRHNALFLEVRTDDGVTGLFGPVGRSQARVILDEIRAVVLGRDPFAIEAIWELLLRRNRHGRSGYYMMAMSALDCALWDLKGKALGMPVYRLLGGPMRECVPAYASMLGFSVEPERLAARVVEHRDLGYEAQKWFFPCGPARGAEGASTNVDIARVAREAAGDDVRLMFDAFHSWDTNYAIDVGRRIAEFRPAWLEEPVPCDRTDAFRRIRAATGIPIATGEHIYTRWQVKTLLDADAVDYIQADPDWCGGISELVKIVHLCSAYNVPVCPHGHSLHAALHVAAASAPAALPMVEFLVFQHQRNQQRFMKGFLEPERGRVRPPDTPGLGIELDEEKIGDRKPLAG